MAAWGPNCWWQGAPSTASRCEIVPHSQKSRSPFPRLHAIKPRISFTHPKSHLLLEHATGITQLSHFFFSPIKKSHFQKPGHAQFSLPLTHFHPLSPRSTVWLHHPGSAQHARAARAGCAAVACLLLSCHLLLLLLGIRGDTRGEMCVQTRLAAATPRCSC